MRIFLSYGHDSNAELVERIKTDLQQRGHHVWFDQSEIRTGTDWRRRITEGVVNSDRVLAFLSKHSTRDPGVCLDEIAIAIGVRGGNIHTILVESEQDVKPPPSVSHIQWLDMQEWRHQRNAGDQTWQAWYEEKFAELVTVVEADESVRFAGEIERLARWLKPLWSNSRIADLLKKELVGRVWLFEAIEQWRGSANRESRLFWVIGAPGVGKSAFAAHLSHYGRDKTIAVQFCEYDKPDYCNPVRIVRTLAFQIATRLPDYRRLLLALPEIDDLDGKNQDELFTYLLANPLQQAIDGGRERFLLVIDALDEAGAEGRNDLVEMLARNAQQLPDWIGLVVTSRPEFDVTGPLQGLKPIPLDTATESNRADIRNYLRRELASDLESRDRTEADRLVEQVQDKSEGVFLYTERFCEEVRNGHLSLDRPNEFPPGLGGIFFQYFRRQFPDSERFRQSVRPALRAILAAREPLPVKILKELFQWQDDELYDFIRPLGSLFPVTSEAATDVIKPYHKALADWLTDQTKASFCYVSTTEGHRLLAQFCRERSSDVATGHACSEPLGDYAVRHVARHYLALGEATQDFSPLLRVVTPKYIIRLASVGNSIQAFADNDCCLQALAQQAESLNPLVRLAHALLGCLLQDIAEERYRSGTYILDQLESEDFSPINSPLKMRAGVLLLFAEAALDSADATTARKLVEEACQLPMSCWDGMEVNGLRAAAGVNLPQNSPLIQNLRHHPLVTYVAHLAVQLPEVAFHVASRVRPKRGEIPNLATMWLAVMEALPTDADPDQMERFFTFTDQSIPDICHDEDDYRQVMECYLYSIFRNKDRFSVEFMLDSVLKCTRLLVTHLLKLFGEEWALVRFLRCLNHLVKPESTSEKLARIYRETAAKALEEVEPVLFQEGKKLAIQVLAYYLRLRFECRLSIDKDMLKGAVLYAFGGLVEERKHPIRFIEPIRVMYPISPTISEEIATKVNLRFASDIPTSKSGHDPQATEAGTVHIGMTVTSNPDAPGLAASMTSEQSLDDMASTMHQSRGMLDSQTILLLDPFAPSSESKESQPTAGAEGPFERNRRVLASVRRKEPAEQIRAELDGTEEVPWRSQWRASLQAFLFELIYRAAITHGERARPMLETVWQSPCAADLDLVAAPFEGLMSVGEVKNGRPLTDEQFSVLRDAAHSFLSRRESYGLTMLAWAATQRPEEVQEDLVALKSCEKQRLFWLILFRDCRPVPEALGHLGRQWLLRHSAEAASHEEYLLGMETLLLLENDPVWQDISNGLDSSYAGLSNKSDVSRRLCRILLRYARDLHRHPQFQHMVEDHLQRVDDYWFDEATEEDESDDDALIKAFRQLTHDFVENALPFAEVLAPAFREIVETFDPEGEWFVERAVLFPDDFTSNLERLAKQIEAEMEWGQQFGELGGLMGGFLDSFARAVSPNKDPLGTRVAGPFADLVFLGSRSGDPAVAELIENTLGVLPATATPTIAIEVITNALSRADVETASNWLPRAGGLLRSETEDWDDLIAGTEEGIQLVMRMLEVDPAFEIISNLVGVFAEVCMRLDQDSIARIVEESVELFGLVPHTSHSK